MIQQNVISVILLNDKELVKHYAQNNIFALNTYSSVLSPMIIYDVKTKGSVKPVSDCSTEPFFYTFSRNQYLV